MAVDFPDIAVVGGDRRESAAAAYFVEKGASVRVFGPPWEQDLAGATRARSLGDAVEGAHVVVGPVRGIDDENRLYGPPGKPGLWLTDAVIERVGRESTFFIGRANAWLREKADEQGFRLVEIQDRDDFAIYNSIPTAEGAIQKAMEESDVTIFGSDCFVLGFGRTGQTLAQALRGLGARVTVVARESRHRARAEACGYRAIDFTRLADLVDGADFIFNTVPDLVLTQPVLARTKRSVVIIDIATAPGGTDFAAAERLGRKCLLAPGLPGKVAPRTAGRFLGYVVWHAVLEMMPVPGLTP